MSPEVFHTIVYAVGFIVLFALGEILFHKVRVPVEYTRKLVHIGTGIICLTFPFYLSSHWSVLFLTVSFFLILSTSIKMNTLKSINKVDRITRGSFLFPLSVYISFWSYSIFNQDNFTGSNLDVLNLSDYRSGVYYILPMIILAFSDPLAALIGKRFPLGKYSIFGNSKTIIGSLSFFVSACILCIPFIYEVKDSIGSLIIIIGIGFMTTIFEAISNKGYDNILIPLSTVFTLYFLNVLL